MKLGALIVAGALALTLQTPASAVVDGVVVEKTDTRFDAVAAFGRTVNLTGQNGPGNDHNAFCNGTLIAPDMMLMARHCAGSYGPDNQPPSGLYTFRFRRNTDGSLGTKEAGWQSFHQVEVTHFTFMGSGILANKIGRASCRERV